MELEFNKVYKYKELCEACSINANSNRERTIKLLSKQYDIEKVGRGEYIIHRQLSEEDKIKPHRHNNSEILNKYNQLFKVNNQDEYEGGIYRIINYTTNEIYIGKTSNFRTRFRKHCYGKQISDHREMLDNGAVFEIVEIINDEIQRNIKEAQYIAQYAYDKNYICYNIQMVKEYKSKTKITIHRDTLMELYHWIQTLSPAHQEEFNNIMEGYNFYD